MRHLPVTEIVHRLVREIACRHCPNRPAGSEALGPEVSRACETACPLFIHLPALVRLARQVDNGPGACEAAVRQSICAGCHLRPTSGDFCADYQARTCPLSTYSSAVVDALQRVPGVEEAGVDTQGGAVLRVVHLV